MHVKDPKRNFGTWPSSTREGTCNYCPKTLSFEIDPKKSKNKKNQLELLKSCLGATKSFALPEACSYG